MQFPNGVYASRTSFPGKEAVAHWQGCMLYELNSSTQIPPKRTHSNAICTNNCTGDTPIEQATGLENICIPNLKAALVTTAKQEKQPQWPNLLDGSPQSPTEQPSLCPSLGQRRADWLKWLTEKGRKWYYRIRCPSAKKGFNWAQFQEIISTS